MRAGRWAVVLLLVLSGALTAAAHPLDLGYLRVTSSSSTVKVTLDIDISAAASLLHHEITDATFVAARAAELASASFEAAPIKTTAGACTWEPASATLTDRTVTISSTAACSGAGTRSWTFPFVRAHVVSTKFELMLKETVGASERLTLIDASTQSVALAPPTARVGVSFTSFVWSGIEHIGAAPNQWRATDASWKLPDGIDHIMFLLGLMLGGGTLLQLLGIASGFTVGHSITLAIAALGVVRPSSSIIEPLVALTIALVAVEALWGRYKKHRWKIAMAFGLIHGFAFANALSALELSRRNMVTALFGFNIGVELGQVICVVAIAPLMVVIHRQRRAGPYIVRTFAAGIFVLGVYWFVKRLMG